MMTYRKGERGFLALTSVLIISAVLMVLMFTTSASSFYARFDSLNSEYKRVSVGLSEACSNAALLKIVQNNTYQPPAGGEIVAVGPNNCLIKSVVYGAEDPVTHRKPVTIRTGAQYPVQNGSWSTYEIVVSLLNPTYVPITPPTCSFAVNSNAIFTGQSVTLSWATAGNATQFTVERNIGGTVTTLYSGPGTPGPLQDTPAASATYTATITGPGGSTQCASPQSVTVQPPLAECADTVIMLTRAVNGSSDLADENQATKKLLDLYAGVIPHPQVGIGSYKGLDGSGAQIPPPPAAGQLTNSYGISAPSSGLYHTTDLITASNDNTGKDIAAAITAANNEFNARGVAGRKKVLILVSPQGNVGQSQFNAAFTAATAAKAAPNNVLIFVLDWGNTGGQPSWAQIASDPNPSNGYFLVPSTPADIVNLFEGIGEKVCPAAVPPPPAAIPPAPPLPPVASDPVTVGSWDEILTSP